MRKKYVAEHVMKRDDMFYYVRHIPRDLANHYSVKRLCFSLKTKSLGYAIRASKSVSQRLEDYWFGIRFKRMHIPAINAVRMEDAILDDSPTILDALDLYLKQQILAKSLNSLYTIINVRIITGYIWDINASKVY